MLRRGSSEKSGSSKSSNGVIEVGGRVLSKTKFGLDEEEVCSYIEELVNERNELLERQENLSSLTSLAEKTIIEANNLSHEIKQKATEEANEEVERIRAKAEEDVEQMVEEKKAEAITIAEQEAITVTKGLQVIFKTETLGFDDLTQKLLEFENKHGSSTVGIFSRYLNGEYSASDEIDEWIDTFILFLGTRNIKRFTSP